MKKSKKIPKTHLPKFSPGGKTTTLSNGNKVSMYDAGPSGNDATSNFYNDKRSQGSGLGKTSNYAAAAAGTLGSYASVANNSNLNSAQRTTAYGQSVNQTADAVIGAIPVWGQAYSLVSGAKDMLLDSTTSSNINPHTGEKSYKKGTDAAAGALLTPTHTSQINDWTKLANGDRSAETIAGSILPIGSLIGGVKAFTKGDDKYSENEKLIAAENQKQQELLDQQNAAYQQQQNDYINNAIQAGMTSYQNQPQGASIKYPHGGMNMKPNAIPQYPNGGTMPREFANSEVEKQENTLNPDGSTTQFDGPSHEQGGIPTNLEKGTMIFSDKLKHNGKTFAQLNKTNMTHKEDKILDDKKASAMSKLTANLMKQAKNKSSEELFEKQESLKQEKIEKYIKRMGGVQKYPYGGVEGDLNNNSIVQQTYQQDPRFYNYQGNPVMKPNVKALGKDTGVSSDIGINNYNNLLNTRAQVQGNNVTMGKQLPKFEYVNDPSKGTYDEQFNAYKKVYLPGFKYGGKKLPKYGNGVKFVPKMASEDEGADVIVPGSNVKTSTDFTETLGPDPYNTFGKPLDSWEAARLNKSAWDADYLNNPNAERPVENPESSKFDWKGLATQGAYFAANNAGNIYDLARADKTETRKYERMTANLLDPTAALRDAEAQTRRAEYNVRGASGGNAGTYLSNRVALNTQNIENKDRIRQQYANANAGILNETSKINTGIANEEILANAKIRANARNIKQSAIASTGSNVANQMNDVRNTEMDQKRVDNLVKMYPSLSKDPEMLKYLMSLMSFK